MAASVSESSDRRARMAARLGLVMMACAACVTPREAGWDRVPDSAAIAEEGSTDAFALAQQLWEKRDEESALREALELYAQAARQDSDPYPALVRLSRGSFLLAQGFVQETEERIRLWNEGAAWAEQALATQPEFRRVVVEQGGSLEEALPLLSTAQIDAAYWLLVNLGEWVGEQDLPTRFRYLARIRGLAGRVEELDPGFHYGAPHRFWGAFYAEAPGPAGGSLTKSREAFERALELGPGFFETRVLMAEVYAVAARDRGLFTAQLRAVLEGDPRAVARGAARAARGAPAGAPPAGTRGRALPLIRGARLTGRGRRRIHGLLRRAVALAWPGIRLPGGGSRRPVWFNLPPL